MNYTGFNANLASVSDYYPFGFGIAERNKTCSWSRFGFNGKEKDDDVYGDGNYIDFGARGYDSRVARWTSLDPLISKFPSLSSYNFTNNNPILYIDPDGKKFFIPANGSESSTKLALKDIEGLVGDSRYNNLITHNIETGEIKFDINRVPEADRNEGMLLINKISVTDKKLLYEVSTEMEGVSRTTGNNTVVKLKETNNYTKSGKVAANLSKTSRGDADKEAFIARGGKESNYEQYDALPRDGYDGQVTISPYTNGLYDDYFQDPEDQGRKNNKYVFLKSETRASLAFHELEEAYYRTVDNEEFDTSHQKSKADERKLPAKHPARGTNPGASSYLPEAKQK